MRRNELDYVLSTLLDLHKDVSDVIFTVDRPLQVEVAGELMPVALQPPIESLTPFQTEMVALNLLSGSQRLTDDLMRTGSCDTSHSLSDRARFRVNIFSQRGCYSIVLRKLNAQIPTIGDLNLPEVILETAGEKTGLVLVTGATGCGKSTTLASVLNEFNQNFPIHIITLEDPVEFVYTQKKATINQRELGTDFDTFSNGLRAARWVISQRLAPRIGGGRFPLVEVMGSNLRTKESIMLGESEGKSFYEIIDAANTYGWRTFDSACLEAWKQELITEETAMLFCSKRGFLTRAIDNWKKVRGENTSPISELRMTATRETEQIRKRTVPSTLKLK